MALRLKTVLEQEKPIILEGQKIVFLGTVTDVPGIFTDEEWAEIKAWHFIHQLGYLSNICADYEKVIRGGLEPIRQKSTRR